MANELGELIKSRKKNKMLNTVVGVSTDEISRLEQENAELRAALEIMVLQFECEHNCEYEYKVIRLAKDLLNKND